MYNVPDYSVLYNNAVPDYSVLYNNAVQDYSVLYNNAQLFVRVGMLLTCRRHLQNRMILLREEAFAHVSSSFH